MKRTFIALDITPAPKLIEDYEVIRHRLRLERINWVQVDNLHITLNFLGDTDDNLLPDIFECIKNVTNKNNCFELTFRSLGVFRNLRDPRVIWIGCDKSADLEQIKIVLDTGVHHIGIEPEGRDFSPHLTLGRVKEIRQQNQLAQLIALHKDTVFQKQTIDKITLYESKLSPSGPEYIPLKVFPLALTS
jgi:2'-5' RNA ligase